MKDPRWHRLTVAEYNKLLGTNIPFRSIDDSDAKQGIVWVFGFADLMSQLNPPTIKNKKNYTHKVTATKAGYTDTISLHENAINAYITAKQKHELGYTVQIDVDYKEEIQTIEKD